MDELHQPRVQEEHQYLPSTLGQELLGEARTLELCKEHVTHLSSLMRLLTMGDRIKMLQKLDFLLDTNAKTERAVDLVRKTRRLKRKIDDGVVLDGEEKPKSSSWMKKRAKVANRLLVACFGEDDVGPGVETVFHDIRKNHAFFYRTQEDIRDLQLQYTRIAAVLFVKWKLTQRQYKNARKLMLCSGNMTNSNSNKRTRLNLSDKNSMVARTLGVEVWPTIDVVQEEIKRIEHEIELEPVSIRDRGPDGKFQWIRKVPEKAGWRVDYGHTHLLHATKARSHAQSMEHMNKSYDGIVEQDHEQHHMQQGRDVGLPHLTPHEGLQGHEIGELEERPREDARNSVNL